MSTTPVYDPPMVAIRGLDRDLWRQIRTESVRLDMTAGELVNAIFRAWLNRDIAAADQPPAAAEGAM